MGLVFISAFAANIFDWTSSRVQEQIELVHYGSSRASLVAPGSESGAISSRTEFSPKKGKDVQRATVTYVLCLAASICNAG